MFAKPSESELNAEYNIIKNGMITATGDKSADNIIYAFKKSKSSIKIMKFMSIAMIILGIPALLIGVGFLILPAGIFFLMKTKSQMKKFDGFIAKAQNDPELSH